MAEPPSLSDPAQLIEKLLSDWNGVALKSSDRHAAACDHFERLDSGLGIASTALAAIAGSTFIGSLQQAPSLWVKLVAGVVGLVAAVLAGIQTTAKFGARAEKHRQASRRYGALIREIAEVRALPPTLADLRLKVDNLRKEFDDAGVAAPDVPPRLWSQTSSKSS